MKVRLKEEMETLLIPLYGRAQMSRRGLFCDKQAEEAVRQIDYDFSRLHIQKKTQVMLSVRSAEIDAAATGFLDEHPGSTVVYLGCGLDARFQRLGGRAELWYDLDFPQVIGIKRRLYPETERYRLIPSSVTDWNWMERVDVRGRPVLVIAEGLLMYLSEADVKSLFCRLRDAFQDVTFVFDAYSCLTAKQAKNHPSLKKTGAKIQWGVDRPETMEAFGEGISHVKTIYLTDEDATRGLPKKYRTMFRLADGFRAAREAHRVFVMHLITEAK